LVERHVAPDEAGEGHVERCEGLEHQVVPRPQMRLLVRQYGVKLTLVEPVERTH
jgi:hypothetical protein